MLWLHLSYHLALRFYHLRKFHPDSFLFLDKFQMLIMDISCIYQMSSFFLVETFQIWHMLEIVCIKFSALYNFIWLHIVIKHCHFQLISFFFQNRFCLFQYFSVWSCRCCYFNRLCIFTAAFLLCFELLWHPVSTPNVKIPVNIIAVTFFIFSLLFPFVFAVFLFSFIQYRCSFHSRRLENLNQYHKQNNCHDHDFRLISIISITDGDISQSTAAYSSCHS